MTELRDIDKTILHHITEGRNDTQKITQETTLKTHRIRYSLKKLEKQGLITVTQPDQMVERVINGQKRVFQHPKQAQLTDKGLQKTEQLNQEDLNSYQDMSHRELVKKTRRLEKDISELENAFEAFRKQVQQKIS
jgi:predicted transcriptional regulator